MIFRINYHPTLIILFEWIFHSHFLLSVAFLSCFSECYKNTWMLCFPKRLIESLAFLLISHYPALSDWVKGNRTELCRRDNNIVGSPHHIWNGCNGDDSGFKEKGNWKGDSLEFVGCLNKAFVIYLEM